MDKKVSLFLIRPCGIHIAADREWPIADTDSVFVHSWRPCYWADFLQSVWKITYRLRDSLGCNDCCAVIAQSIHKCITYLLTYNRRKTTTNERTDARVYSRDVGERSSSSTRLVGAFYFHRD